MRISEAALFRAEDDYADLTEVCDMLDALSAALGRMGRKVQAGAETKAGVPTGTQESGRFAALFTELGGLLHKMRWGAFALARLDAAERFAAARDAYEEAYAALAMEERQALVVRS